MKKGILKISSRLRGFVKAGKTKYNLPKFYVLPTREPYNNAHCDFELDGGTVTKILIDGKELPKDTAAIERKEQREADRMLQAAALEKAEAEEKKHGVKFKKDSFNLTYTFGLPKEFKQQ